MKDKNTDEKLENFYCGHVDILMYRNCAHQCSTCKNRVTKRQKETQKLLDNKD